MVQRDTSLYEPKMIIVHCRLYTLPDLNMLTFTYNIPMPWKQKSDQLETHAWILKSLANLDNSHHRQN